MRTVLLLATLLAGVLAGCTTAPPPAGETPSILDPAAYVAADVPRLPGAAIAAEHAKFVTTFPLRRDNTADHEASRVDLMTRFASYGLDVYRQNFTDGIDQANILGIKWGVVRDHWVVVGGHYDIINQPNCNPSASPVDCPAQGLIQTQGAYDNGSGTALTFMLAQAYANITPYYTIVFVGMDGEERGTQGAAAFVDIITSGNSTFGDVTIIAELDLDMLGLNWPGVNAPIYVINNDAAAEVLIGQRAAAIGFPENQIVYADGLLLGSSDYVHFWRLDDPPVTTVFLISNMQQVGAPAPAPDVAHTPSPVGVYPFWHLEDTVATMRIAAGDPPTDDMAHPNVEAGFESAFALSSEILHFMACEPLVKLTPVPMD